MKRNTDLLPKRIIEIQEEFIQDTELNDFNLHDKTMRCPGIKGKYLSIFFEEEAYLKKLERAEEQLIERYVEEHGQMGIPKFKTESEAEKSEQILKIRKAIKQQKEVVRFCDGLYKIVSAFGFEIKNAIDIIKLEN